MLDMTGPVEHGFMPKRGPGYPGESRDFGLPTIPCHVVQCPANAGPLTQRCAMPSCINIGPDGRCATGVRALEDAKNQQPVDPKPGTGWVYKREGD